MKSSGLFKSLKYLLCSGNVINSMAAPPAQTWIKKDFHVHESHSSDAPIATVEKYCRVAEKRDINEICFTTHLILSGPDIQHGISPDKISKFVNTLAYRIASFPAESIALAKKAVLSAEELPLSEGLLEEEHLFNQSLALPAAKERMKMFIEFGGQTRETELDISTLLDKIS